MPGADDVHVVLIESLAEEDAAVADAVHHLRHAQPLAGRPALMRAEVTVGVVFVAMADDADFLGPDLDQPHAAFGDLAVFANQHFGHACFLPLCLKRQSVILRWAWHLSE